MRRIRLVKLPDGVRSLLADGSLSSGHARALITLDAPDALAKRVVAEGLSVRETEQLANRAARPADSASKSAAKATPEKDADTKALEKRLGDALGLKVAIAHKANGKGRLSIDYKDLDQLDDLVARLEGN